MSPKNKPGDFLIFLFSIEKSRTHVMMWFTDVEMKHVGGIVQGITIIQIQIIDIVKLGGFTVVALQRCIVR